MVGISTIGFFDDMIPLVLNEGDPVTLELLQLIKEAFEQEKGVILIGKAVTKK